MKKSITLLILALAVVLVISSCVKPSHPTEATLEIVSITVLGSEATITWKLNTTAEIVAANYKLHVNGGTYETAGTVKTVTLGPGDYEAWVEGEITGKYEDVFKLPPVHVESEKEQFTVLQEYSSLVEVNLVEYMTGPAAAGVNVEVFDSETGLLVGLGETDPEGTALIELTWYLEPGLSEPREVMLKALKTGMAPSVLKGLMVLPVPANELADSEEPVAVDMAINRAAIDPLSENYPQIEITMVDGEGNEIDPDNVTTNVNLKIKFLSELDYDVWDVLYVGLGYVPWAGGRNFAAFGMAEATYVIPAAAFSGELQVHVVVYDHNRARLDQIVNLNFTAEKPEPTETFAPSGLWLFSWTSSAYVQYYSLPSDINGKSIFMDEATYNDIMGAPKDGNLFTQIAWDLPEDLTGIVGFNIYRSADGVNYKKIAFRTSAFGFDHGIGVEAGNKYYYKVRSVYADGTESEDSNVATIVPLDLFNVKLLSPANNSTDVSRRPNFRWTPVDKNDPKKLPVLGGGLLNEGEILYHYTPWIYDTVLSSGQHILPIDIEGYQFDFETAGPSQVSVKFLDPWYQDWAMVWVYLLGGGVYVYPYDGLEAFKTYEWGLDYAYAQYVGEDEDGDGYADSVARSIAMDLGFGLNFNPNVITRPDYYNRFTTGEGY